MKIYNTMTRKKEEFVPIHEGEVRIYACGPTVYNFIHIGNARPICVFDTLRRYLEYRGYQVTFVQNFTDIDDKIIKRANEENSDYLTVSEKYIAEYKKDAGGLNVREASVHPKATENVGQIIKMVKTLEDKGFAYSTEYGDVYFRTNRFSEYGKLSHQPLEDLEAATPKKTRWILHSGRAQNPENRHGILRGVRADRAGILNAPLWQSAILEKPLTFTAAVRI